MLDIPCKISSPVNSGNLGSINRASSAVTDSGNIESINKKTDRGRGQPPREAASAGQPHSAPSVQSAQRSPQPQPVGQAPAQVLRQPPKIIVPALANPIKKGQKVSVSQSGITKLDIRIGWNVNNAACDIDVSAFMLGDGDKVISDDWFVFYSQPDSPDRSVHFSQNSREDRQEMTVDLQKIDRRVKKTVFVLTIYEAAARGLNFGMISDAYIRILDNGSKREIVSFKMSEYYSNVLSMVIGEVYSYKGEWKFSAVGNGIGGGLEELCGFYGVELK